MKIYLLISHASITIALAIVLTITTLATITQTATAATATTKPLTYQSIAEEQRFRALTNELRCVMCQNQSLADSDAPIAKDLRKEIVQLIREGKSDKEIKQFLVARYSAFILYRPELTASTWLLWFGPGLFVLSGIAILFSIIRKRSRDISIPQHSSDTQDW